jgi:DNA helicase TIP49 (TBP-interacting protein)
MSSSICLVSFLCVHTNVLVILHAMYMNALILFVYKTSVSCCRHAVQLLTPANIVARTNGRDEIVKVNIYQVLYVELNSVSFSNLTVSLVCRVTWKI